MNKACSILIPTYNRPNFLKRLLEYYDSFKPDYDVIVADSSSDNNKQENRKTISCLSHLNTTHIDHYSTDANPLYKMTDALNYAQKEFCVICGDDDFVTPNGINQSIGFLEENLDFTVAHGHYITFSLNLSIEGNQQFDWAPYGAAGTISFEKPDARLYCHLSTYRGTFYGVHRTTFLQMIFNKTLKFADDPRFGELLPSMLTLIHGKSKALDVFYAARESNPDSWNLKLETFSDFMNNGSYDEKYSRFRNCLSIHLSRQSGIDIRKAEEIVDMGMANYMGTSQDQIDQNIAAYLSEGYTKTAINLQSKRIFDEFLQSKAVEFEDDLNRISTCVLSNADCR